MPVIQLCRSGASWLDPPAGGVAPVAGFSAGGCPPRALPALTVVLNGLPLPSAEAAEPQMFEPT
jgi:hypothetical protein